MTVEQMVNEEGKLAWGSFLRIAQQLLITLVVFLKSVLCSIDDEAFAAETCPVRHRKSIIVWNLLAPWSILEQFNNS